MGGPTGACNTNRIIPPSRIWATQALVRLALGTEFAISIAVGGEDASP